MISGASDGVALPRGSERDDEDMGEVKFKGKFRGRTKERGVLFKVLAVMILKVTLPG